MAEGERAEEKKNERLLADTTAQLAESTSSLQRAARLLPSDEDFHFYSNFNEFREPVQNIQARVETLLSTFSSIPVLSRAPILPSDPDDRPDWLVRMQDELLEQVDYHFDLFRKERVEKGLPPPENDGFMYQSTRKKRRHTISKDINVDEGKASSMIEKKTEKCPVPFHVWSIPRPQGKFDVPIDNSNTPFKHGKSSLGFSHNIEGNNSHPLQDELQSLNFEDVASGLADPKEPASLSETPFTFVNTVLSLKDISTKLSSEQEIAVDLEHHQFRSFQGLTCLMQISTHSEDFIIDTLELRSHIGPLLHEVFASPAIEKVMHGAKLDILWLQRDFGIYVCNLFDTGQAARVLEMESFGLASLLERFCGIAPDKRYQRADWRLRPLPAEMIKYAREDTHYLLYVGDVLKHLLVSRNQELLFEVYRRSKDICLSLYEKEITTETSYLQVYGLGERNFQTQQLAVLAGLYSWRDQVARAEDESTGYVLPNQLLLKLAEEMPDDVKQLRTLLQNGRYPLVIRNLATILSIINTAKSSVPKSEVHVQLPLQAGQSKPAPLFEEVPFTDSSLGPTEGTEDDMSNAMSIDKTVRMQEDHLSSGLGVASSSLSSQSEGQRNTTTVVLNRAIKSMFFGKPKEKEKLGDKSESGQGASPGVQSEDGMVEKSSVGKEGGSAVAPSAAVIRRASASSLFGKQTKVIKLAQEGQSWPLAVASSKASREANQEASFQGLQIEDLAFDLGNRTSLQTLRKGGSPAEDIEQAEAECRAKKIRASFSLPFHTFSGVDECSRSIIAHGKDKAEQLIEQNMDMELQTEDVIPVEMDSDEDQGSTKDSGINVDGSRHRLWWPDTLSSIQEPPLLSVPKELLDASADPIMPPSLSQRYGCKGLQSEPPTSTRNPFDVAKETAPLRQDPLQHGYSGYDEPFKPFDYAAAKQKMGFKVSVGAGVANEGPSSFASASNDQEGGNKNLGQSNKTFFDPHRRVKEFRPEGITPGKRRQVFPQTGNRTGVFK